MALSIALDIAHAVDAAEPAELALLRVEVQRVLEGMPVVPADATDREEVPAW